MNFYNIDYRSLNSQEYINLFLGIEPFRENIKKKVRHYTLNDHTKLVLDQYSKYFYPRCLPEGISLATFRLILLLHDIGKYKAHISGNRSKQWSYSVPLIKDILLPLKFEDSFIDLVCNILKFDSIGLYMQGKISDVDSKKMLEESALLTNFDLQTFFQIQTVYYQCDIASYTLDGGGQYFLEHLFEYDSGKKVFSEDENRLKFSINHEAKFKKLELLING